METMQLNWNHVRAFVGVADTGSFSAAAARLQTTQPTIGRQIGALEMTLGVVLFERIGRKLQLTPDGQELLGYARKMDAAADGLGRLAFGKSDAAAGVVTITCTDLYANTLLLPMLPRLRAVAPDIHIDLIASNERVDLQRREADIAIRNGDPVEPELIQTRLPDGKGYFYAAKTYVVAEGPFECVGDAANGDFIDIDTAPQMMMYLQSLGMQISEQNFRYRTESLNLMWDMVRNGLGIGPCDSCIGDKQQLVERVFPDVPAVPIPRYLMVHRDVRTNRRVRLVFDFLAAEFASLS